MGTPSLRCARSDGCFIIGEETAMLLSICVQSYLDDCYGLAPGTQALYSYHLSRLLDEVGDVEMGGLEGCRLVRGFMSALRRQDGKPYSPYYLDQVYRTLNTFFVWCVREEVLDRNPMDWVRRPRVPRRKSPRLTLEEVERLLEAVGETGHPVRNLAMVCLAVDSGLRRGEVLGLEIRNVDLDSRVVRVLGKGSKERDIPVGEVAYGALRAYLAVRPASSSLRVFLSSGGKPLTRNGLQTLMYRLKKRSGLPELRWHLLRHTFANHFINGGGGLRKLQKILGHSSIKTTADIYTDPELNELQEVHGRVSPLMQIKRRNGETGKGSG